MRILLNLRLGLLAASVATMSLAATVGQAQYAPYQAPTQTPVPQVQAPVQYQQPAQTQAPVPYQQPATSVAQQAQQAQQYGAAQYAQQQAAAQQYAQQAAAAAQQAKATAQSQYNAQQQYVAQQTAAAAQNYSPAQGYVQPQPYAATNGVPYVASRQNAEQVYPVTPPVDPSAVAPQHNGYPQPVPSAEYPAAAQPGNPYAQAAGAPYEAYPAPCNGAACSTCEPSGGRFGHLMRGYGVGGGYWFGGVYGLYMDRDNSDKYSLSYVTDPSMPTTYPPAAMDVVMTTRSVDEGFQPGVEFRLGRTFGGGFDPCGGCCGPQWGLETVYWTLFDQDDSAEYVNPTGTSRTYTMMPMYGLEYDHGAGYMPVNQYWDHGMPSDPANATRVTRIRQSSSFEAQNLEVNLLRLGVCGGGPGGATFNACSGVGACADNCCAPRGSRYSCTAVCGFRWMQFDEDFMFGVDYENAAWPTPTGYLNYYSNVENNLLGAQIGCNGMYRIGCKWGVHLNTLVGLYGNDIDVRQYFVSPTGDVRYIGTGEAFDVNASKTDVSMLGELRLGVSYQATCRCRLYTGWRAIGVTGLALASSQTPNAFLSGAQMANYVNSNDSMILHGLQTGVEWNY